MAIDWAKLIVGVGGAGIVVAAFTPFVRKANWQQLAVVMCGVLLILFALFPITHLAAFGGEVEVGQRAEEASKTANDRIGALGAAADARFAQLSAQIKLLSDTSQATRAADEAAVQTLTARAEAASQVYLDASKRAVAAHHRLAAASSPATPLEAEGIADNGISGPTAPCCAPARADTPLDPAFVDEINRNLCRHEAYSKDPECVALLARDRARAAGEASNGVVAH